jgi:uncharacterized membrane protein YqaE (UPF0057 family)
MKSSKTPVIILIALIMMVSFTSFVRLQAVVIPQAALASVSRTELQANSTVPLKLNTTATIKFNAAAKTFSPELGNMGIDEFLTLTPTRYKELTGKKLGLMKSLELKVAQKYLKKKMKKENDNQAHVPQWLYVVMAIFFLGWLAIGIQSNWKGNNWWICLLLYFLFWLPGVIYALVVMDKYY